MKEAHYHKVDMGKYFNLKQRAYLINVSEHRDREQYESLSGVIVGRGDNSIALKIPYHTDYGVPGNQGGKYSFKVNTEVMGNGIQVIADLLRVETGNIFHLGLRSNLEMYQRRQAPRIDAPVQLYQIQRNTSLDVYRREFAKIADQIRRQGIPENLAMREATVNVGMGGIRLLFEVKENPSQLSLFILRFQEDDMPICALAELVWERLEKDSRVCGYRFIQISKTDQERISGRIQTLRQERKITVSLPRANWELLDRMVYDGPRQGA